jgi:diguanylate cyclase (GGDEF)-like protein
MTTSHDYFDVFRFAPVSLWVNDYSAIKSRMDGLRAQGVADFKAYLAAHPQFVDSCMAAIEVVEVNDHTLTLFKAKSREELLDNLHRVFRDDMRNHFAQELVAMWGGDIAVEVEGINYALDGTPIHMQLTRRALPGHELGWARVLVSIADVTDRFRTQQRLEASEAYAQGLFEHSPVSLWVEDYSELKSWLDRLKAKGITNFARHMADYPDDVLASTKMIKLLDVNRQTLKMLGANSKQEVIDRMADILQGGLNDHWKQELLDMWNGKLGTEYEGVNFTLAGDPINILMAAQPLPGYESSWERVLVAINDITTRKKAEAYVAYLGTHDSLTSLKNRAFYEDSINAIQRENRLPTSVIVIDVNGLKAVNDQLGHDAGDQLIRRSAEVLRSAVKEGDIVARTGGDEFMVLLPFQDERVARKVEKEIARLVDVNNQFHSSGPELAFAVGTATAYAGMTLAQAQTQADKLMYESKRAYYASHPRQNRRGEGEQ